MLKNIKKLVAIATGSEAAVNQSSAAAQALLRSVLRSGFLRPLLAMAALTALGATLESVMPYAFRHVIDALTLPLDAETEALRWFCVLLGLGLGSIVAFRSQQAVDVYMGPRLSAYLQSQQIDQLFKLSPAFLAHKNNGTVVQAIKGAAFAFLGLVQLVVVDFVQLTVVTVAVATVLFQANSHYALVIGGWAVVYVIGVALLARRCFILGFERFMATGASAGEIGDTILNFETVFNFARFEHERTRIGVSLEEEARRSRKLRMYVLAMRVFAGVAVFTLLATMCWMALRQVLSGQQTVGLFVLVFSATNVLVNTVFDLSRQLLTAYENIGTLFGALSTIADLSPLPQRDPAAPPLIASNGRLRFDGVWFRFPERDWLFKDFSLDIGPGERVGLVGPSGAGKTTLLRLLLSQVQPEEGRIEIDGQDIATLCLSSLQQNIATVSQVPSLFNRSFGENISYARPDVSRDEIVRVSKQACLHDVISTRLGGYEKLAGQAGGLISGGERQRLSIARAMLKDSAAVLLLDEATSALDSETEHQIQSMLANVFAGRTVLAIAHRLSTIRLMDRIVFLDDGKIVEQGTHESLLMAGGRYAKLWALQEGQSHMRVFA